MTDAERWVRSVQTEDGMDFTWCDEDHQDELERMGTICVWNETGDTTRHEWPDGSAIVSMGGGWDYGVHATRLEAAQRILDNLRDSGRENAVGEPEFSWTEDHQVLTTEWTYPEPVVQDTVATPAPSA